MTPIASSSSRNRDVARQCSDAISISAESVAPMLRSQFALRPNPLITTASQNSFRYSSLRAQFEIVYPCDDRCESVAESDGQTSSPIASGRHGLEREEGPVAGGYCSHRIRFREVG